MVPLELRQWELPRHASFRGRIYIAESFAVPRLCCFSCAQLTASLGLCILGWWRVSFDGKQILQTGSKENKNWLERVFLLVQASAPFIGMRP